MKLLISIWLTLAVAVVAAEPELRTWTSQSGAKVEAKLIEQKGDDVVLEKADGKQLAIRLDKLSEQDQEYVRSLAKPAEPAPAGGVPIEGAPPAPPAEPAAPQPEAPAYADPDGKWKAGEISGDIEVAKDSQWSYMLYAPKSFDPKRKWPVVFLLTQDGGGPSDAQRFVPGAELCGWIVVVTRQVRKGFFDNDTAINATVEDVLTRLPIDPKRVYLAGYLEGAYVAIQYAIEKKGTALAGLLICNGSHLEPSKVPSGTAVYGLCGSNSYRRWSMACIFREFRSSTKQWRFYIGENEWPAPESFTDGLIWLNYTYLQTVPASDMTLTKERKSFVKKVQTEVDHVKAESPERAYEWVTALSGTGGTDAAGRVNSPQLQALLSIPKVKRYADGQKDLDRFVKKNFATKPDDYNDKNGTKEAKDEAEKLAETYKDTYLEELFHQLGRAAIVLN